MKHIEAEKLLERGAEELGVCLPGRERGLFMAYLELLEEWNKKINLTAIKGRKDIVIRHFLDSLTLVRHLKDGCSLLDIGSGAGFPGIPVKIVLPHTNLLLIDAVLKKVHFMRHVARELRLKGIEVIHGRAEDRALVQRYGRSFDVVVSRAFSALGAFMRVAIPYSRKKGIIVAVKGPKGRDELRGVDGYNDVELVDIVDVRVPFSPIVTKHIVLRRK